MPKTLLTLVSSTFEFTHGEFSYRLEVTKGPYAGNVRATRTLTISKQMVGRPRQTEPDWSQVQVPDAQGFDSFEWKRIDFVRGGLYTFNSVDEAIGMITRKSCW